jgi:hypothetical protein
MYVTVTATTGKSLHCEIGLLSICDGKRVAAIQHISRSHLPLCGEIQDALDNTTCYANSNLITMLSMNRSLGI